ncbi:MAG: sensor histidine kinase [Desulfomonilaceae bacterium]
MREVSEPEKRLELLQRAFNVMSSGVLVLGKQGEVLVANQSALCLLGLDESIIGQSLKDVLPNSRVFERETGSQQQAIVTLQDGTNRLLGFSSDPCGAEGSRVIVFRDITAVTESKETWQRAEKLAIVGEMMSRLSHEIKNPLASIVVGLKTLQRDTPQSSQHGIILKLLSAEVDSLTNMINRLLSSCRPRTHSFRPVYLEPLLRRAIDAHGLLAIRHGVGLELARSRTSTTVIVDEQAMLGVLGSLVQNALDACSKGDLVRIGWRELDQAGKDDLVPGFSGKVAVIFVEDTGSGIPDEVSSSETRIFRAFFSTKTSGSGLGLTVSRDIVEGHGGLIVVDSRPNHGTEAKILLPHPAAIPCWDWHRDRALECPSEKVDCRDCEVRSSGTGYCCWTLKGRACREATGDWPERCLKCGFFRASSLIPFFRSRLVTSRRE